MSTPTPSERDAAETLKTEWGDAAAAVAGSPGAPDHVTLCRLIVTGDALAAALTSEQTLRLDMQAAVEDAHAVLDEAGITPAQGVLCAYSGCQTKLGHRVRALRSERDALRAQLAAVSLD